ncbi:MAG TPA: hypothetical protein VHZ98_12240 [Galbitalea sp.]|jgi:hypothetical protein|nr:hypothetical protein [Galbitalea sp.]
MAIWVEQIEDERVIHGTEDGVLHVSGRVRLLGHAYDGVHIHPGGTLITSGIIGKWLRIDTGGAFYSSGLVSAQPQLADDAILEIRGELSVPRLPRELHGTILIAVGARYNDQVLRPDGTLIPRVGIEGGNAQSSAPRYRIAAGGREPVLHPATALELSAYSLGDDVVPSY